MTTQLRLVEPPAEAQQPTATRTRPAGRAPAARPTRGRAVRSLRGGRRSANWGDWRLDATTRSVGRAGVAEARRALEAAIEQELSQAS